MNITCSVCSCACHGTCLPGSYRTRQSSTWSPPTAWRWTPSTNSHASRPDQVPNGRGSGIGAEEVLAAVLGDGLQGQVLVEDYPLPLAPRLPLLLERGEHALRRRGHLGHPHADGVVDRIHDRRRLRVVRHLADRLRAERSVCRRVLEDHVVE